MGQVVGSRCSAASILAYGQLARRGGRSSPLGNRELWSQPATGPNVCLGRPGRSRAAPARATIPMARVVPKAWAAPPPQAGAWPHGSPVGCCPGSPPPAVKVPVPPAQDCWAHQSSAECATVSIPAKAMAATSRPSRTAEGCLAVRAAWEITWPRYAAPSLRLLLELRRQLHHLARLQEVVDQPVTPAAYHAPSEAHVRPRSTRCGTPPR